MAIVPQDFMGCEIKAIHAFIPKAYPEHALFVFVQGIRDITGNTLGIRRGMLKSLEVIGAGTIAVESATC